MELCGFTLVREVGSIHRPEPANRQDKRLNGQADRLNGFSVESEAHEAWLCLRREALGITEASRRREPPPWREPAPYSAPSFAETTGPVASRTALPQTKADPCRRPPTCHAGGRGFEYRRSRLLKLLLRRVSSF